MKIKCTTDRKPWVDGKPLLKGDVADVDDALAKELIKAKFAEKVATK